MGITTLNLRLDQRKFAVICFSFFFAWILAVPFEGQVLYALTEKANVDPSKYIFISILANFIGLISCGFIVRKQISAKIVMIISILICVSGSMVFFLEFSMLWYIALIIASFFAGLFVASFGFYVKNYAASDQRYKMAADVLIYSNIIMIIINVITVNLSVQLGLMISIAVLLVALVAVYKLEAYPDHKNTIHRSKLEEHKQLPSVLKPFLILCLFITIITINSGLMYQVVTPAYGHFEVLASYYWAVPYILALIILRNLPKQKNQAYILYIAMAMIGLSYIAFMWLDPSISSYLLIDTLMLGAFGVCDLFWWSILVRFFDYSDNPARILGIGSSMNVLGILIGGFLGNKFLYTEGDHTNASVIALIIIFIVLIMLPVLNVQLTRLFKNHIFLVKFAKMDENEQVKTVQEFKYSDYLTEKESEVVKLLLKGYTYKGVADSLFVTENTMKYHIKNIYQKLNINSKMELIKLFSDKE
ncbi:MAG: helix-turn-helix transcriptional regulator [Firmicutes bacterium HGW-Firmicutes-1]|jgi:DNA-binding CsgD family transcriptional regulator|nr:MAG: helix-turn-helix transcriptional regulator [Firmicutes bacterium HGW-Firmicutes-1]